MSTIRRRERSHPPRIRLALAAALAVAAGALAAGDLLALPSDRQVSQYVRRRWTIEQGLPHGTVRGFAQTAEGYLWLATYEGLVRFDGERFRVFDRTSTPALPNSTVLTVTHGRDGTLWVGTVAGLLRYHQGSFTAVPRDKAIAEEPVNAILEAPDGTIWVGTWGGLRKIEGGTLRGVALPPAGNLINALALAADGSLWIGTNAGGLLRRRGEQVEIFGQEEGLASDTVLALLPDGRGGLFVGTGSGLDHLRDGVLAHVPGLPVDQVTALRRDRDANLWVGTYSHGLFRLHGAHIDLASGVSPPVVSAYALADGLLDPTIRGVFEDDEGSLWVGTNRGLEQLRTGSFVTWNRNHGLGDDFTRAVFADRDGILWAGTAHGLSRRGADGRWTPADDPRLRSAYVLSIGQGADGTHFFGTSNGLFRVDSRGTRLLTTADGLASNGIRAIFTARGGDVWLATDAGINRLRPDGSVEGFAGRGVGTDYAIGFAQTPDGRLWSATGAGIAELVGDRFVLHSAPQALPSNRLFGILADAEGTLWLATDGDGLLRYRDGHAAQITSRHGLPYDKLLSLADDGRGNLWFGTVRGAFAADKQALHAIADAAATLLDAYLYDESDGLGSRQCNGSGSPAVLSRPDGRVWFATAGGLSALAVDLSPGQKAPRPPVVERVTIDGVTVPVTDLASISPDAARIEVEFSGVTLSTPHRLRFRYRLAGYDEQWIDAGSNRSASFTSLPAGSYRFLLGSSLDGRRWSSLSLPFVRRPHVWERKPFLALTALAAAALLLGLHFMRLHLSRQRANQLARLVEQRTRQLSEEKERTETALRETEAARREAERHEHALEEALVRAEESSRAKSVFLATTSHELRTPLNAIIGFSGILLRGPTQLEPRFVRFVENINSSGNYLLGIINNILDLSKIEAGRMDLRPEPVELAECLEGVVAVMRGVTSTRRIAIEVELAADLPPLEADPIQLKQILYNLIANAAKFSADGSPVTVSARPTTLPASGEEAVEIRVVDRGVGIAAKDHGVIFQEFRQAHEPGSKRPEGTGLGLALVRRFVEMHRGTIRVESDLGSGSTFVAVLPCRQPRDLGGAAQAIGSG